MQAPFVIIWEKKADVVVQSACVGRQACFIMWRRKCFCAEYSSGDLVLW